MNFFVTFGQRYRGRKHPQAVNGVYPQPDGFFRIVVPEDHPTLATTPSPAKEAMAYDIAFGIAKETFGMDFSGLYSEEGHAPQYFPLGELGVIGEQVSA